MLNMINGTVYENVTKLAQFADRDPQTTVAVKGIENYS